MLSIGWISLPPEALQRMASQDDSATPRGRRWERIVGLATAGCAGALVVAAMVLLAV
jgi:hypothetical protein